MWTCPTCNRIFRNTNQSHSCTVTDIESHFINKPPEVKLIFEKIVKELNALENVKINSLKNAILFTAKSHFLAIKPKKEFLDIEFVLHEKDDTFPVHKIAQASKNKWAHFLRLGSPDEVDSQFVDWVMRAYEESK